MPEIAEVRVVASTLKRQILNKKIDDIKILYPRIIEGNNEEFVKQIKGTTFKDIKTCGKWLIFDLGEYSVLSHLRMEGKYFYVPSNDKVNKHTHVIFKLDDNMDLRYDDVRKFGKMLLIKTEEVYLIDNIKKLGYEPEDERLTPDYLLKMFNGKNKPIKTILLDQSIINGLGNIYANEVLFASGVNPNRPSNSISLKEAEKIINVTRKIIARSFELGGCTIRSYTSSLGVTGHYQNELKVHNRENMPCIKCKSAIRRIKIAGRSTYYCEKCQK